MIRVIAVITLVTFCFSIELPWQSLNSLRVTFPKFTSLPTTKMDAEKSGWVFNQTSPCLNANWRGLRYILNNDYSLMLLYSQSGKLAGIQVAIKSESDPSPPWEKQQDELGKYYTLTYYFVDPNKICGNETTIGDRIWLQNGNQFIQFPLNETEITANSTWKHGGCLIGIRILIFTDVWVWDNIIGIMYLVIWIAKISSLCFCYTIRMEF
jgi:hypothetical protein